MTAELLEVGVDNAFKPVEHQRQFRPPLPDLPSGKQLPSSLKEYLIIERTAQFVREVRWISCVFHFAFCKCLHRALAVIVVKVLFAYSDW